MNRALRIVSVATLVMATLPHVGVAADFCVASGTDFSTALKASVGFQEARNIKVVAGTYALTGLDLQMAPAAGVGTLTISGGYSAGCVTRNMGGATVLSGGGNKLALNANAPITVEDLTLQGFDQGITVDGFSTELKTIRLRNLIVRNNTATVPLKVNAPNYADAELRLTNVLAYGNTSASCTLDLAASHLRIAHLTSANNSTFALCTNSPDGLLRNSIFWGNSSFDLAVQAGSLQVRNSTYTTLNGALAAGSGSNDALDPKFVNAATGDFRLMSGSPAIDAGTDNLAGGLPALDIGDQLRLRGTAPDRGAYETTTSTLASHVVTNTNDSGAGSLRQAVIDANGNANASVISFNIPGGCPKTISLTTPLPDISAPLRVEGWTQPGAAPNILDVGSDASHCIVLVGTGAASNRQHGFHATGTAKLEVRGVDFSNFSIAAIRVDGGSGHRVQGVQVGGDVSGFGTLAVSGRGVLFDGAGPGLIGGMEPGMRNVLGAATFYGVALSNGANGSVVENNYIGLDAQGLNPVPNWTGLIIFDSPSNTVRNNYIAGNTTNGVSVAQVGSVGNAVTRNVIGLSAGNVGYINGGIPISVNTGASANIIGNIDDTDSYGGNYVVTVSGQPGVSVTEASTGNRIVSNALGTNSGDATIELGAGGREPNDSGDTDTGPNNLQNYPQLTGVSGSGTLTAVRGNFTHAAGSFTLHLYSSTNSFACNALTRNMPTRYPTSILTLANVPAGDLAPFSTSTFNGTGTLWYTMTATDAGGNTSPASPCIASDTLFNTGMEF